MSLSLDDAEQLRKTIIDPIVDRVEARIALLINQHEKTDTDQFNRINDSLGRTEENQKRENRAIEQLTPLTDRMGHVEEQVATLVTQMVAANSEIGQWRKFKLKVALIWGVISAIACFVWAIVKDRMSAWMRGWH